MSKTLESSLAHLFLSLLTSANSFGSRFEVCPKSDYFLPLHKGHSGLIQHHLLVYTLQWSSNLLCSCCPSSLPTLQPDFFLDCSQRDPKWIWVWSCLSSVHVPPYRIRQPPAVFLDIVQASLSPVHLFWMCWTYSHLQVFVLAGLSVRNILPSDGLMLFPHLLWCLLKCHLIWQAFPLYTLH